MFLVVAAVCMTTAAKTCCLIGRNSTAVNVYSYELFTFSFCDDICTLTLCYC